jgi:hypothetical protein
MKDRSSATGSGLEPTPGHSREHGNVADIKSLDRRSDVKFPNQLSIPLSKSSIPMTKVSTPIIDFYKGRSVFITGATGFVGKATVEKILRTCPDVGNVYILVRPKAGAGVAERVEELLNNSVYLIFFKVFIFSI